MIINKPFSQVLVHSPHVWQERKAIEYPLNCWRFIVQRIAQFDYLIHPGIFLEVESDSTKVHYSDRTVGEDLSKQVRLELNVSKRCNYHVKKCYD